MLASEWKNALSRINDADLSQPPGRLLDKLAALGDQERIVQESIVHLFNDVYDGNTDSLRAQLARVSNLCDHFLKLYGDGPVTLLRAPARINILGEHVDYVSYLPTASLTFGSRERDMLMLYRADDSRVSCASTDTNYLASSFALIDALSPLPTGNIETDWSNYLDQCGTPVPNWHNYVEGAVRFAGTKFGDHVKCGFDFVVDSNIPAGGGASSSSALVVLAGAAIRNANGISYTPVELARDSAMAEWYIGTRGGSMDHTTICLAQIANAVLINYSPPQTRRVSLPGAPFHWITFFSKPADKGREIMIHYNERAAVSRLLIPAVIAKWDEKRRRIWSEAIKSFSEGSIAALETIGSLLAELPETISLDTLRGQYPDTFKECERSFSALLHEHTRWPLPLRARALHHLGEMKRVAQAKRILDSLKPHSNLEEQSSAMNAIGRLITESHQSLAGFYAVSTDEVEGLIKIIRSEPGVLGARLMGGGFGGNVLALTTQEHAAAVIERVQAEYYEPQDRNGLSEGSIMISTPGDGLADLSVNKVWQKTVGEFNVPGSRASSDRSSLITLIDALPIELKSEEVWPVVVAAGKGTRASASGLNVPKPVAPIGPEPAIVHVLRNVRRALGHTRSPVVIVSPETEYPVRKALESEEVRFVLQSEANGTGDAVANAYEEMRTFDGLALVVWSTQPVIHSKTIERTVKVARLFDNYVMIIPTTLVEKPYAPLTRSDDGRILSAKETHLEEVAIPEFGETNIGLFVLKSSAMFKALFDLKQRFWDSSSNRYERPRGELGFPNELINYFAQREAGVFASPLADKREEQGIKQLSDIDRCERFIRELKDENRATLN